MGWGKVEALEGCILIYEAEEWVKGEIEEQRAKWVPLAQASPCLEGFGQETIDVNTYLSGEEKVHDGIIQLRGQTEMRQDLRKIIWVDAVISFLSYSDK